MVNKEIEQKLTNIGIKITRGTCSHEELAFLQNHKQDILNIGNPILCELAGITEEEFNKGKLNPDLKYQEPYITLEVEDDGEGNPMCSIIIDDEDKLTLTTYELIDLYRILTTHKEELNNYFNTKEDCKYIWE